MLHLAVARMSHSAVFTIKARAHDPAPCSTCRGPADANQTHKILRNKRDTEHGAGTCQLRVKSGAPCTPGASRGAVHTGGVTWGCAHRGCHVGLCTPGVSRGAVHTGGITWGCAHRGCHVGLCTPGASRGAVHTGGVTWGCAHRGCHMVRVNGLTPLLCNEKVKHPK